MSRILYKVNGDANLKSKPKVYFTCHPDDFAAYFDKLCQDIFKTHDCTIFYKEDMAQSIDSEDQATDLGSHNLFIIPVTLRLMTQPNQAMDVEIPYAIENGIPILPIVMEPGIDEIYRSKFENRQYICPYSSDNTEISYQEKLRIFLDSVLINDEMANRIRNEFDAYFFLSYRKKDRRYANDLMKLIHSYPECLDIAIWYDEFLIPGENFLVNIQKMLAKSKLFTMLVTPSLLEQNNGEPNFVMETEYPAAHRAGIDILPVEMKETDHVALVDKFAGIPACVDPSKSEFKEKLLGFVSKTACRENDEDPIHAFLIGMAYWNGIDVEINRDRGLALMISAAEDDLPEAMQKLYHIFTNQGNYREALKWAQRLANYYEKIYGLEHPVTIDWMEALACTHSRLGTYHEGLAIGKQVYALSLKLFGKKHPNTLRSLRNLSEIYRHLGDYDKALKAIEEAYRLCSCELEENQLDALASLRTFAKVYHSMEDLSSAKKMGEKAYALSQKLLGSEHPDTLVSANDLAVSYINSRDLPRALSLLNTAYALRCEISGKEHPETLTVLRNLALCYSENGDLEQALMLHKKVYTLSCAVLGDEHPDTIISLHNLACAYSELDDHEQAVQLCQKARTLCFNKMGEDHPVSLNTRQTLADIYRRAKLYTMAMEEMKQVFFFQFKSGATESQLQTTWNWLQNVDILVYPDCERHVCWQRQGLLEEMDQLCSGSVPEDAPQNLFFLIRWAQIYMLQSEHRKALPVLQRIYTIRCKILGEDNADTLGALNTLAYLYNEIGNHTKALELFQKLYTYKRNSDAESLDIMRDIASTYRLIDEYGKALEWYHKANSLYRENHGEESIGFLGDLVSTYIAMDDAQKVQEYYEKLYGLALEKLNTDSTDVPIIDLPITIGAINRYPIIRKFYEKLDDLACDEEYGVLYLHPLATKYAQMGEYAKALKMLQKLYDYWRIRLGEENQGCIDTLNDMANIYSTLGDHQTASQCSKKASELQRIGSIKPLQDSADACWRQGEYRKEAELREKIYTIQCEIWGKEDQNALITLYHLATAYLNAKDYPHAKSRFEELYALDCKLFGPKHPSTITTMHAMLFAYVGLGEYEAAQKLGLKAYMLQREVLGEEHHNTKPAMRNLQRIWQLRKRCRYCGGTFSDDQICSNCKRPKNY